MPLKRSTTEPRFQSPHFLFFCFETGSGLTKSQRDSLTQLLRIALNHLPPISRVPGMSGRRRRGPPCLVIFFLIDSARGTETHLFRPWYWIRFLSLASPCPHPQGALGGLSQKIPAFLPVPVTNRVLNKTLLPLTVRPCL